MTTSTYSSVLDHSSTAGFRAWGAELNTNLALVGLVQTGDTGQINWATTILPGAQTVAGYEIWRFADSSLFIKLEYGTSGRTGFLGPGLWITVGTGSNGSGTITGQTSTRASIDGIFNSNISNASSTSTPYASYVCHTGDAFTLVWKANAQVGLYPMASVCVGKTVDNTGVATTIGFGLLLPQTGYTVATANSGPGISQFQSVRIASVTAAFNQTNVGWVAIPGNPTSSVVGSNFQIYPIWLNVPQVLPFQFASTYVQAEILRYTTFSLPIVGLSPHTYLTLGTTGVASSVGAQSGVTYGLALIFE